MHECVNERHLQRMPAAGPAGQQRDQIIGGLTTRNYSKNMHEQRLQRVQFMQEKNYSC